MTNNECVEALALALGLWMGTGCGIAREQEECFIEAVLRLAYDAGVPMSEALAPFDVHPQFARDMWAKINQEKLA